VIIVLSSWVGCGGGSGPAASSETPSLRYVNGLDFTISPMVGNGTTVEFRWVDSGAPAYRVEVGSASAASDAATLDTEGAETTVTWTSAPVGTFYARVRGRQGSTLGPGSVDVLVESIDARSMIDALVFGKGPLAVAGNAAAPTVEDRMEGWQPGSTFTLIVGESVSADHAGSIDKTVQQIGPATSGSVRASVEGRRPDPLPSPGPGEVTVSETSAEQVKSECRCDDCVGCAWSWNSRSFIRRGRILVATGSQTSAAAHELGHVIGLAHVISPTGVHPPFTMGVTPDGQYSPRGQLDVLEPATVRMLKTLYDAGLTPGSSRRQFEAAGFVAPETAGAAAGPAQAARRARARVVGHQGDETIVLEEIAAPE
jgi:hypothetical protein